MKNINELLDFNKIKQNLEHERIESTPSISNEAIDLVNELFMVFKVHVKTFNIWTKDSDELEFIKHEWVLCFQQAKLEMKDVIQGANKIRKAGYTYMITPAEFISLCKPTAEELGLPSLENAFRNAIENSYPTQSIKTWLHPVIRLTTLRTGSWNLVHEPQKIIKPLFEKHYQEECRLFAEGKICEQLEHDSERKKQEQLEPENISAFKHLNNMSTALKALKDILR